jgi:recombination protein RecA
MAVVTEVVTKRGAFFSFGDTRLGQGRENSKLYLKEHPEMLDELYRLVCEKAKSGPVVTAPVQEAGEPEPELAYRVEGADLPPPLFLEAT